MKKVKLEKATLLIVEAHPRYWEDSTVNSVEDTEGTLIPLRVGGMWRPVIELDTGLIRNWTKGTTAKIHYKVCDAGSYWLANEYGKIAKYNSDYVPSEYLCVGGDGFGDYIIMKVDGNGHIEGWAKPEMDEDEWEEIKNKNIEMIIEKYDDDAAKGYRLGECFLDETITREQAVEYRLEAVKRRQKNPCAENFLSVGCWSVVAKYHKEDYEGCLLALSELGAIVIRMMDMVKSKIDEDKHE